MMKGRWPIETSRPIWGRIHYAWVIVAGCFLLSSAGTTILINCIGIFIKPVSTALGFPRGNFALFYTFATLATTLVSPFMGSLLQKSNQRLILITCSCGASLMLCSYSLCNQLWQFYLVGFLCGLFTGGLTSMSISSLVNRWFVKKRGMAIAIAFSGSGVGSMILNPMASHLIETVSWQMAFIALALVLVSVNIPVSLFIIRNKPEDKGLLPYGAGTELGELENKEKPARSIPREEAITIPAFWAFALAMLCAGVIGTGVQQHINAYLTDVGYSASFAASIFSMVMACLIGGKIVLGWMFDRLGAKAGSIWVCTILSLSSALFLFVNYPGMPFFFAICFGIAYSILSVPPSFLTSDLLGPEAYCANYGVINMFLCAGMAIGSPISAYIYDFTGSYRPAWLLYSGMALVILVLLLFVIKSFNCYRAKTQNVKWKEELYVQEL